MFSTTLTCRDDVPLTLEVLTESDAVVSVGPYQARIGIRELRALEVAVNMAIDELERRAKKESA